MSDQNALRDELLAVILPWLQSQPQAYRAAIEGAVAAASVAATCIACLREDARQELIDRIVEALPEMVKRRAGELRSGAFDDALARRRH